MATPFEQILARGNALLAQQKELQGQKTGMQEDLVRLDRERASIVLKISKIDQQIGSVDFQMNGLINPNAQAPQLQAVSTGPPVKGSVDSAPSVPRPATAQSAVKAPVAAATSLTKKTSSSSTKPPSAVHSTPSQRKDHLGQSNAAAQDINFKNIQYFNERGFNEQRGFNAKRETSEPNEGAMLSRLHSTVVYKIEGGKGKWSAISCHVCGANTTAQRRFISGLYGLRRHHNKAHGSITIQELSLKCTRRSLSEEEASRIYNREDPEVPIEKTVMTPQLSQRVRQSPDAGADDSEEEEYTGSVGPAKDVAFNRQYLEYANASLTPRQQYMMLSEQVPNIVCLNQTWTEISCKICGSNANRSTNSFFLGMQGLTSHIRNAHRDAERPKSFAETARSCEKRVLAEEEAFGIRNNQQPFTTTTMNFGSKTKQMTNGSEAVASAPADDDLPGNPTKRRRRTTQNSGYVNYEALDSE